jgi:hypothetical protein
VDRSPPGTPETSRPVAAIPPAYRTVEDGRRRVIVREDSLEVARESGFVRGERRGTERGVEGGRTIHPLVDVPPHGTWLWKRCRRGGAAAHLLRDRYLRIGRFLEELRVLEQARRAGIPVTDLAALAITRVAPGVHRVEQLIRHEAETRTLAALLADPTLDASARSVALAAVAEAIARLHAAGLRHGDLNLRNILVRESSLGRAGAPPPVILIDLDPPPPTRREAHSAEGNLLRLLRSWARLHARDGLPLSIGERARFLRVYCGGIDADFRRLWRAGAAAIDRGRWLATAGDGRSR